MASLFGFQIPPFMAVRAPLPFVMEIELALHWRVADLDGEPFG